MSWLSSDVVSILVGEGLTLKVSEEDMARHLVFRCTIGGHSVGAVLENGWNEHHAEELAHAFFVGGDLAENVDPV